MLDDVTDREMVVALGEYINSLLGSISDLEKTFTNYRIPNDEGFPVELPWREDAKLVAMEEGQIEISAHQRSDVLAAIGDETLASGLIRALHDHYLGK